MLLIVVTLSYISHLIRGDTTGSTLLKIGIGVLVFAPIPLLSKMWPGSSENRLPLTRWIIILGLAFVAQVVAEFQDYWFPQDRFLAHLSFAISLMLLIAGVAYALFWPPSTR